jgi:hypothetical protein
MWYQKQRVSNRRSEIHFGRELQSAGSNGGVMAAEKRPPGFPGGLSGGSELLLLSWLGRRGLGGGALFLDGGLGGGEAGDGHAVR